MVIATLNRPDRLGRLLQALGEQTLERSLWEVIVVDDGSRPPAAPSRPGVRLVRNQRPRGPAAARNQGWRAARAPLVAFTDDDCRPSPRWLETALRAYRADPGAILQGVTLPDPEDRVPRSVLVRTQRIETLGPQFETCNVLYPRAVLAELGGFDETYPPRPSAEDTDLAWRAIEAGHRALLAPDAIVYHAVERLGARGMLRVALRWEAAVRVLREHDGARGILWRGVFWNAWHYLMWRSLLALILPLPRSLRRLILARHLRRLARRAREDGSDGLSLAWAIPFLVLHDGVECAAVLRGAIRHRVLVL